MGCANDSEKEKEKNKKKLTMSTREVINPTTLKTKQEVKIVLLGEAGVGKSSLVNRYCKGTFSESYKITIGGAYLKKEIILKNGNSLIFHFWDTGGQERFRSMASLYYKDASAAILCFDVGDKKTLDALTFWIEELKEKGNPPFGFPLVTESPVSDVVFMASSPLSFNKEFINVDFPTPVLPKIRILMFFELDKNLNSPIRYFIFL